MTERTLVQLFLRQAASRGGNPAMFHRDGDHWAPIGWDDYATQARASRRVLHEHRTAGE